MKKFASPVFALALALLGLVTLFSAASAANNQQDNQLAHGKYIATIAGCTSCHTPDKPEYQNLQTLTLEQIKTLAFDGGNALDNEKFLAGGRAFDLGPAGVVFTLNLTPDEETGLGTWTDEQIKIAIKTGLSANGRTLFPVMPYHVYNSMADEDVNAVVAYLRSVKAVKNTPPASTVNTEGMPTLPYQKGITAPSPSNKAARGAYLVNSVMGCGDCHTPVDPTTGAPQMEKHLAGRQPYEGPWGIVYGGNITPDKETGIGNWTEEEIKRSLVAGIGKDGRRLILMPWYAYAGLTKEDADAVAYYLKNELPAVNNPIPAASLNPEFNVFVEQDQPQSAAIPAWLIGVVGAVVVIAVAWILLRKKPSA